MPNLPKHQHLLDTSGLYCPEPIMLLHQKLKSLTSGAVLLVVASDPATSRDIPKLCQFLQHELLHQEQTEDTWRYWIAKG